MSALTTAGPAKASLRAPAFVRRLGRSRRLIIAIGAFLALLATVALFSSVPLGYYDLSSMATSGATLALAAMGQTIVILSGGFDLSAGAVISLVNVTLASRLQDPATSPLLILAAGVGIGALSGAFNGFFVAILRMQPIVVTLSTMFILQGITLLVMDKPGGAVSPALSDLLIGDAIPSLLPQADLLIGVLLALWVWLKRTRFGIAIYAIGSDRDSARAAGVSTRFVEFIVYVIAGGCYGLAGAFISAQTGSGDPLVGNPMLLQIFAAIVVGGTTLGGGRGGPLGTIFGAYILMMVVNILLELNVSAYYSTVAEGTILILAVLTGVLQPRLRRSFNIPARAILRLRARRQGLLPSQRDRRPRKLTMAAGSARAGAAIPPFLKRHAETLRFALPAYVCFLAVVLVTQLTLGHAIGNWNYYNSLIVLSWFLAMLALGQGSVILTGGLDLSLPWTIGLCGILLAGMVKGSDGSADLCVAAGARHRRLHRPRQWRRRRPARHIARRHDAGPQRHSARGGAGLFQWNSGRVFLAAAAAFHDRPEVHRHAGRRVCRGVRGRRRSPAGPHRVRAAHLCGRQRRAGGRALRRLGRPHADRRLHAVGPLLGHRRRDAHRLFRPGQPGDGRRLSPAVHRGGRDRGNADHRRTGTLSRHARRRPAADDAADAARRHHAALMPRARSSTGSSCSAP